MTSGANPKAVGWNVPPALRTEDDVVNVNAGAEFAKLARLIEMLQPEACQKFSVVDPFFRFGVGDQSALAFPLQAARLEQECRHGSGKWDGQYACFAPGPCLSRAAVDRTTHRRASSLSNVMRLLCVVWRFHQFSGDVAPPFRVNAVLHEGAGVNAVTIRSALLGTGTGDDIPLPSARMRLSMFAALAGFEEYDEMLVHDIHHGRACPQHRQMLEDRGGPPSRNASLRAWWESCSSSALRNHSFCAGGSSAATAR